MAKPPQIVEIVAQASSPASSCSVPLPVHRVAAYRGGTPLELAAGTAAPHLVAVRKHLPEVLKVRLISDHGNVNEIIGKFGGRPVAGGSESTSVTGDELLAFINNEEASLPRGKRGPGLFRYLRLLTSSDSAGVADTRRDVIATVFKGVQNRMVSGYLLRDVINKLAGIHFTSSSELQTLTKRGRCPPPSCWPMAATSTARIRARRKTSRICRPRRLPPTS